ncbi:SRPBCC family protein [Streptomyces albidoflavus]|uniref:SRPBCC family protein n=1 Tax=Streptomyces albidoflavus TaxID=1886 RepID=UPI0033A2203E
MPPRNWPRVAPSARSSTRRGCSPPEQGSHWPHGAGRAVLDLRAARHGGAGHGRQGPGQARGAVATRTVSRAGPAAPETAWERYARPALWPRWAPHIRRVETDADRIAPGVRGRVFSYAGMRVRFAVERVDESRRMWTWRVALGPLVLRLCHEVTAAPGGGSGTRLTVSGPLPVVVLYRPVAAWALGRLVARER